MKFELMPVCKVHQHTSYKEHQLFINTCLFCIFVVGGSF